MTTSISRKPGIYVLANTQSGNIYIGQSHNLRKRIQEHKAMLRGNYHPNQHLQHAWNKYGEKAFVFKVLELCDSDRLDEREQHYLDVYVPKGICYNISSDVKSPTRGKRLSEEHRKRLSEKAQNRSEEHKQKLLLARHNRAPITDETRARMSSARRGKKHTPETLILLRQKAQRFTYIFISPDGSETTTKDITAFCNEHQLNARHMRSVANGQRKHHKGWQCKRLC